VFFDSKLHYPVASWRVEPASPRQLAHLKELGIPYPTDITKGEAANIISAHRLLREAEVRIAQGETAGKICRGAGISEQTYYKWRREYGGLKIDQAKRLKELERENERPCRATGRPRSASSGCSLPPAHAAASSPTGSCRNTSSSS
jgi:hypothetical protein